MLLKLRRRKIALVTALLLLFLGSGAAFARYRPQIIKISTESDLDFGKIANIGGGRVRMNPDGERTLFGRVENLGGPHGPASIDLQGQPRQLFLVYAPKFSKLRRSGGGRLSVLNITSTPAHFGRFDKDGAATVKFGGELIVRPNAWTGHYRGSVSFWIVYI